MAQEIDPSQVEEIDPSSVEEIGAGDVAGELPPVGGAQGTGPGSPSFWQRAGAQADALARAFNRAASFGLHAPVVAAGRWMSGSLDGEDRPYGDYFLMQEAEDNKARREFPKTTIAGGLVGSAGPAMAGAATIGAMQAAGTLPAGWGAATIGARAGMLPAGTAAAVGAVEGGLQGAAEGDPQHWYGPLVSGGLGAATGGALSGATSAALNRYASNAPTRLVEQTTQDVTKGAVATARKRFGKSAELVSEYLNQDRAGFKLRDKLRDPRQLEEVISDIDGRIERAAEKLPELYQKIDGAQPFSAAEVMKPITDELKRIERKGGEQAWRSVLETVKRDLDDHLVGPYVLEAQAADPAAKAAEVLIPSRDVRSWVTKLLKTVNETMGSLAETERIKLRQEVFDLADRIYDTHLERMGRTARGRTEAVGAHLDRMARDEGIVSQLRPVNRELASLLSLRAPLEDRLKQYKAGKFKGLAESALEGARRVGGVFGVPVTAGMMYNDPQGMAAVGAGVAGLGTAAWMADRSNRLATWEVAKMVQRAQAGDRTAYADLLRMTGKVPAAMAAPTGQWVTGAQRTMRSADSAPVSLPDDQWSE